ncbi:FAD:protein FMN transferase [Chryseolinea sp. H1M3-3]|uniref:FAD:protein FMN transferase n=1 Tax=Chryseolinea sp. H1M3-3 TaxID=3034144 RepID=UPI0023EBFF66|nr:FAD:protein FMN transferase [Chryseolinea sp. H1M3-3]
MENNLLAISPNLYKRALRLMGNMFEISVLAEAELQASESIDAAVAEMQRIERLFTTFDPASQTNQINAQAGIQPVRVDREVFELIQRSIRISELTSGAFDITYGSIDKRLWNFDTKMSSLPDKETAKKSVRLINYKNIILDNEAGTVFLKEKGMRIGFGGIGKGYAADQAKKILKDKGITSGIVNASGDLSAWGHQQNGKPWTIGIADPDTKNPFSYVNITNMAVATSGNYEKYVTIGGQRYSHTIDPRTGFPVTGIKSVTIISPYAELSDAMATPVMVMGTRVGLDLINQINSIACIIVDDANKIHHSQNIQLK